MTKTISIILSEADYNRFKEQAFLHGRKSPRVYLMALARSRTKELTARDIEEAVEFHRARKSYSEIGSILGISKSKAWRAVNKKRSTDRRKSYTYKRFKRRRANGKRQLRKTS